MSKILNNLEHIAQELAPSTPTEQKAIVAGIGIGGAVITAGIVGAHFAFPCEAVIPQPLNWFIRQGVITPIAGAAVASVVTAGVATWIAYKTISDDGNCSNY